MAGSGRVSVVQNTHTLTYQKKPGNVATVPSLSVLRMKENSETLQLYAESFVPDHETNETFTPLQRTLNQYIFRISGCSLFSETGPLPL